MLRCSNAAAILSAAAAVRFPVPAAAVAPETVAVAALPVQHVELGVQTVANRASAGASSSSGARGVAFRRAAQWVLEWSCPQVPADAGSSVGSLNNDAPAEVGTAAEQAHPTVPCSVRPCCLHPPCAWWRQLRPFQNQHTDSGVSVGFRGRQLDATCRNRCLLTIAVAAAAFQ